MMNRIKDNINIDVFFAVMVGLAVIVGLAVKSDVLFWAMMSVMLLAGFFIEENKHKTWWQYLAVFVLVTLFFYDIF